MSESMGLIALLDEVKRIYADRMKELSQAAHDRDQARRELDALTAELSKLQSERKPRDNGDGTVTVMLPVTYPKGLDVEEVRAIRPGDLYRALAGPRVATGTSDPHNVYLILRPAPQPPEPVTWEARIADGDCEARSDGVATKGLFASWWVADALGVPKPAKLGTYQFVNGVGTLIKDAP